MWAAPKEGVRTSLVATTVHKAARQALLIFVLPLSQQKIVPRLYGPGQEGQASRLCVPDSVSAKVVGKVERGYSVI